MRLYSLKCCDAIPLKQKYGILFSKPQETLFHRNEKVKFGILFSPPIFSLGKYYQEDGELTLNVGPFTVALEFASGREATIVGKPSADFFASALKVKIKSLSLSHDIDF